jgi:predicted ATPase
MKIAFNGLKGFTEKETSVNLSEITVLTGKNSSGKSSFNKLLNLIFSSFKNIKSLYEIFNIKIDIGNEKFGGKKYLQTY